jgi:tagatose-1,6-bisphosphate aldolase
VTATVPGANDDGPGTARAGRLRRLAGTSGVVAGIALDHRDSLRVVLERRGLPSPTTEELRELKLRLARVLAPAATAIMLDEEFGGRAIESGVVPPTVGLIMPLEAQGYEAVEDGRTTSLLEEFSPARAAAYGADACKLLLPYRVDHRPSAVAQEQLVVEAAAACHALELPFVVEPVVYRRSGETAAAFASSYRRLVVDAVRRLAPLGPDLLKLPFPVTEPSTADEAAASDACRALDEACGPIPWVLLGGGAVPDAMVEQVRIAGAAGSSGFLAGRGIWAAALVADAAEGERIATTVCRPAFERCRAMAERSARPLGSARA